MYRFILNNFILKKDEQYVLNACEKGYITEEEKDRILAHEEWLNDNAQRFI